MVEFVGVDGQVRGEPLARCGGVRLLPGAQDADERGVERPDVGGVGGASVRDYIVSKIRDQTVPRSRSTEKTNPKRQRGAGQLRNPTTRILNRTDPPSSARSARIDLTENGQHRGHGGD
ncbi:hypothetical protein [Micromonospora sp. NPDC048830]|uniref:hypothetical protein n=1 Tax=Micromonospora sp. NPDC048830 TaxID=3364257 RepID=UPI003712AA3E